MLDHIAGNVDPEIGKRLQNVYEKQGMVFHLSAQVTEVSGNSVTFVKDGKTESVEGDYILLATGRRPATTGFGLENLSLEMERGRILVNETLETNVPGVYAIGDVIGGQMLAHVASREGEVAVNHILGIDDKMSYAAIPSVIYTDPEVAAVGFTKAELQEKEIPFIEVELPMGWAGRYQAETERGTGMCRVLFDKETKHYARMSSHDPIRLGDDPRIRHHDRTENVDGRDETNGLPASCGLRDRPRSALPDQLSSWYSNGWG